MAYEDEYKAAVERQKQGVFNGLSPTEIDKKYGKYKAPTVEEKYASIDNYRKNELEKLNSGYYDNADNRRQWLTPNEQKLYDTQGKSGLSDLFSQSAKGPSKYDDWNAYFSSKDVANGIGNGDTTNAQASVGVSGVSSRAGWNPNQRNTLAYGEAADRAKQQLDPLYERALENVRKQRYQNELNAGEVASARGISHSGLAADQLNKIGIATQSNISDLDAQRASEIAEYAQRMVEFDQQMALQERAQQLSEYLGVEGLNLNRDQFDWGKYTDTRNFDYQKTLDDRNFNYQLSRDEVADQRYEQEFAYQKTRDQIADQRYQQEYDEDVRRWGLEFALQKQVQLGNLSIAQAELALAQAREARMARGGGGGGGSNGGGGSGGSGSNSTLSNAYQQYQQTKAKSTQSPVDQYYNQMENIFKGSVVRQQPVYTPPAIGSNPNLSNYDRLQMMKQQYGIR